MVVHVNHHSIDAVAMIRLSWRQSEMDLNGKTSFTFNVFIVALFVSVAKCNILLRFNSPWEVGEVWYSQ